MSELTMLRKDARWFLLNDEQLEDNDLLLSILQHEEDVDDSAVADPLLKLFEMGWQIYMPDNAAA